MTPDPKKFLERPHWKDSAEKAVREGERARRAEIQDYLNRLKGELRSCLGQRYHHCTLENFEVYDDAQNAVLEKLAALDLEWFIRSGGNLLFYGPSGTGKDHLAVAMLLRAVELGFSAKATKGLPLFSEFKESYQDGKGEMSVVHRYDTAAVLLISDPVTVAADATPDNMRNLFRLVDSRYESGLPTWVTINAEDRAQAIKMVSGPIFDRLMHGALPLFCNWPSYRERNRWQP